jgi:2-polyprenyl-6-methoxyphenol hydroxylase-like FAD-dependent oxidoreductase
MPGRPSGLRMNRHAVVIGGGIGGLLAAHALACRFRRVTVLERDRYPTDFRSTAPPARRGVPQSRCLHLLMAAGVAAVDELMPGWREELVDLGAIPFDVSADAAVRFPAGWLPRTPSGITTYACSRALLEHVLRRGLSGKSTVHMHEGQKVVGLLGRQRGEQVIGVRTTDVRDFGEMSLVADLVVDASGRGSTLPDWIDRLSPRVGSQVEETVVQSRTQYVSRWFRIEPADAPDWHCLSIAPAADTPRSAMMLRAEGDRWAVVLLAPIGEPLPVDDKTFLDFAGSLGEGKLGDALLHATPLSPIHHYGVAANRMRHYDRLPAWPPGLITLGDAVCALDPYFGLGMTTTARGAVLLGKYLEQQSSRPIHGLDFQKELASLNAQPWELATGRDPDGQPLARDEPDLARLYEAAPSSSEVAHALLAVQHLLRPVETLMEL